LPRDPAPRPGTPQARHVHALRHPWPAMA
jgi:hypothetical protein